MSESYSMISWLSFLLISNVPNFVQGESLRCSATAKQVVEPTFATRTLPTMPKTWTPSHVHWTQTTTRPRIHPHVRRQEGLSNFTEANVVLNGITQDGFPNTICAFAVPLRAGDWDDYSYMYSLSGMYALARSEITT